MGPVCQLLLPSLETDGLSRTDSDESFRFSDLINQSNNQSIRTKMEAPIIEHDDIRSMYSNEVQGNVYYIINKDTVGRSLTKREIIRGHVDNALPVTGVFVVVNEDGRVVGFAFSTHVKTYMGILVGREVTDAEYNLVCNVCVTAVTFLTYPGSTFTSNQALSMASLMLSVTSQEITRICQAVFRGPLFQYHVFDSVTL